MLTLINGWLHFINNININEFNWRLTSIEGWVQSKVHINPCHLNSIQGSLQSKIDLTPIIQFNPLIILTLMTSIGGWLS